MAFWITALTSSVWQLCFCQTPQHLKCKISIIYDTVIFLKTLDKQFCSFNKRLHNLLNTEIWWRSKRTHLAENLAFTFGRRSTLMPLSFFIYFKITSPYLQDNSRPPAYHCCQGCVTTPSRQINVEGKAAGRVHFSNKCLTSTFSLLTNSAAVAPEQLPSVAHRSVSSFSQEPKQRAAPQLEAATKDVLVHWQI